MPLAEHLDDLKAVLLDSTVDLRMDRLWECMLAELRVAWRDVPMGRTKVLYLDTLRAVLRAVP
jgi:hypothetical protein